MARHRNIRNYAYEEDMFEDVYGHSVEEHDLCVSPTTAQQFMFHRGDSQHPNLSSFMEESLDYDEEDNQGHERDLDHPAEYQEYQTPKLDKESEAKLNSCLDQFRSILGDHCDDQQATAAIIKNNFDLERAIDEVLDKGNSSRPPKSFEPRREKAPRRSTTPKKSEAFVAYVDSGYVKESQGPVSKTPATPDKKTTQSSSSDMVNGNAKVSSPGSPSPTKAKGQAKSSETSPEVPKIREGKTLLNLVVIGHVDAGKSTLMGHVLYQVGDVSKRTMHKYEQDAKKAGKASFAYAWVMDETGEERERGITMDVGLTRIETKTKIITLMDAPGHKDFIPNMISGAAQADVAVLVVASSTGEFEAGFESGGQTREHAILIRSLGVSQLLVAVNKLDTVNWSKARYDDISTKLKKFLKQVGFKEKDVNFVPCSGLTGENLTKCSEEELLTSWYNGPSLIERIDAFNAPERPLEKPFRLCISDVFKGTGSGISVMGKTEGGRIKNGDKIMVMPAGLQAQAKNILVHGEPAGWAQAGDHVNLTINGLDMVNITVGSILCDPLCPIQAVSRLKSRIVVFDIEVPLTKGFPVLFHFQTINEPAVITKLISVLHKNTGEITQRKPRCLTRNTTANIELELSRPVCVELFKEYKDLGRFMLRYGGKTIAAGIVTEIRS